MSISLIDLRVIESSAFIAAPLAGLTLAQYGADVIRVDMIGGGIDYGRLPLMPSGRSLYWTGLNKGKRSIAIDLRRPEGRELIGDLAAAPGPSAGVLLTNIGVPWLSHANLSDRRADMISCTIEGNPDGTTAVDYTVNCATGYPAATGEGSLDRPVNHVLPAWDIACAYQAALAIMAAVERRGRTGQGAELRLSLADVAFTMLSHLGVSAEAELLGTDRPAIGNHIYGAFGRDFGTKDGRRIMVAGISAGQWKALVKACALNDGIAQIEYSRGCNMAHEADRYNAREEIAALIEPWVAARSFDQVKSLFDAAHVCWGAYDSPTELMNSDPRVALSNPIWGEVQTSGVGRHRAAGATVRLAGEERSAPVPAPLLGEHTDAVLADVLGLGSGAIGRLHDNGVVAGPDRDPTVSMA
eukprot:TRINITY_DN8830_c0_g1_i6.p1 TRINITY_DN8830_c0_g1~~TRINITY_DN8830_c0_g1_i6.p1  ORF type:complete len:413 (+),score=52.50 TRINITY_DN8830_c0_g1_i6:662-1900(+)